MLAVSAWGVACDPSADPDADGDGDGGTNLAVGDPGAGADPGRVLLSSGPLEGEVWTDDADAVVTGTQLAGRFGAVVGRAGDTDADGYTDLAMGSVWDSTEDVDVVRLFPGPVEGGYLATDADAVIMADPARGGVGRILVSAGDMDGDGRGDLALEDSSPSGRMGVRAACTSCTARCPAPSIPSPRA